MLLTYRNSFFCYAGLVLFSFTINATAADDTITPNPPTIAASSYILQDFNSGRLLAEKEADKKVAPASLTKIMTAYVIYRELASKHLTLDDKVTISRKAWQTSGSKMFVEVGKQVRVEDLLKGMIIQSGTDASVALAEHVGGTEATFAAMMNQHAARLGMSNFPNIIAGIRKKNLPITKSRSRIAINYCGVINPSMG
jgi:D-alanyl-D-alanine carboxypeptidase (penicillin-binding protein 5/6)